MQATSDKTASANFTQTGGTKKTNFGADANTVTNGKTGYHPYYQWGRKDAARSAEYSLTGEGTDVFYSDISATVGTTIKNPTTFYSYGVYTDNTSETYCMPYAPLYYNAWNAIATTYGAETTKTNWLETTVKTVYDPCPVGYTVPPANTFSAFTIDNLLGTDDSAGRIYTTSSGKELFFPYSGRRNYKVGYIVAVNRKYGFIWSAVCGSDMRARQLRFNSTNQVVHNYILLGAVSGIHSGGCCIRPVREK